MIMNKEFIKSLLLIVKDVYDIENIECTRIVKYYWTHFDKRIIIELNSNYFIKAFSNDWYSTSLCNDIVDLLSIYQKDGIPFAKLYTNRYREKYLTWQTEGDTFYIFFEEKMIGIELTQLNESQAYEMGKCLGKMHLCSTSFRPKEDHEDSIFGIFTNSHSHNAKNLNFINVMRFYKTVENANLRYLYLIREIRQLYIENRINLNQMWKRLPHAFVTNDFLIKNIAFEKKSISGVFDFHLACSKVLVYDYIQSALFNFRILTVSDRKPYCNYRHFCSGYLQQTSFNEYEIIGGTILGRLLVNSWESYLNTILNIMPTKDITEYLLHMRDILHGYYDNQFMQL